MRALILIILGLGIGILTTVTVLSALRQATPLSRAVMTVTGHQLKTLQAAVSNGACDAATTNARMAALRFLADDFESALLPSVDDALTRRYIDDYRSTLDTILTDDSNGCPALEQAISEIKQRCDFCHRDFR
jgi:hypothetical protein